uniref:Uncharacterized protein n=1 Tax=Panagrolaimus superbus TaxID=310955 RepID=A0A914YY53_9BILA
MNHEIAAPRADKNVENVANEKDANPPPSVSRDDKKGNGEISVQKIDEDQKKPSDAIKDVEEEDDDDDGW